MIKKKHYNNVRCTMFDVRMYNNLITLMQSYIVHLTLYF